ncbi:hypothetical protein HYW74_02220 [Candidatus Pacearchaeota archaeon]|nr:hypothetical protein [Candidatus Pacearchaeota archaeon]
MIKKVKKGVSNVIITVLIVLVVIALVAIVFTVIIGFVKKNTSRGEEGFGKFTGQVAFDIKTFTTEDLLYDRIRVQNTGEAILTSFVVRIDGVQKDLIGQKRIKPGETKELYLKYPFPSGEHKLAMVSSGVTQEVKFNILNPDWHVSINNTQIS